MRYFIILVSVIMFLGSVDSHAQIKYYNACAVNNTGNTSTNTRYFTATTFYDDNLLSTDWVWDFGDGTPTKVGRMVQHEYNAPGLYTITLNRKLNGIDAPPEVLSLNVFPVPETPHFLQDQTAIDTTLCTDFELDPYKFKRTVNTSNFDFKWYPEGDTTRRITAKKSDLYSVKVTDRTTGCYISTSVKVKICGRKPVPSVAQYHFGNGIIKQDNHGDGLNAQERPGGTQFLLGGVISTTSTATSVQNPNQFRYQRYMFSSDGTSIFDNIGRRLPYKSGINKSSILPVGTTAQSSFFVPLYQGGDLASTEYVLFVIDNQGTLSFSQIEGYDKQLPTGPQSEGIITKANIELLKDVTQKLVLTRFDAILNQYSLIGTTKSGEYYTLKIDKFGVTGPIFVSNGLASTNPSEKGQIKINSQGNRVMNSYPSPTTNRIQICDFSATNGIISGCSTISIPNSNAQLQGIEFSPDGENIFYTLNNGTGTDTNPKSELYRYNITNNSHFLLDKDKSLNYGTLKRTFINGNEAILMAVDNVDYLSAIFLPNAIIDAKYATNRLDSTIAFNKDAVGYIPKAVDFNNNRRFGINLWHNPALPQPPNDGGQDDFTFQPTCERSAMLFQANAGCQVNDVKYQWNFGDGSPTGAGQNPSHVYNKPGFYTVSLIIVYCDSALNPIKKVVEVLERPVLRDPGIIRNCFYLNAQIRIQPEILNLDKTNKYNNRVLYEWDNPVSLALSTLKYYDARAAGLYRQLVINNYQINGQPLACETKIDFNVVDYCDPIVRVPDILTPNGDNVNDKVKISTLGINDDNFEFRIYNRWGELVYFEDVKAEVNWDGTFKGKACQNDTYAWVATYRSQYLPADSPKLTSKGAILLVR